MFSTPYVMMPYLTYDFLLLLFLLFGKFISVALSCLYISHSSMCSEWKHKLLVLLRMGPRMIVDRSQDDDDEMMVTKMTSGTKMVVLTILLKKKKNIYSYKKWHSKHQYPFNFETTFKTTLTRRL